MTYDWSHQDLAFLRLAVDVYTRVSNGESRLWPRLFNKYDNFDLAGFVRLIPEINTLCALPDNDWEVH